jgi:predicted NBD/HSP70 family sugar kinase
MAERLASALIEDHKIVALREYPEDAEEFDGLLEIPSEDLCEIICDHILKLVPDSTEIHAVGVALPGIVRNGVVEDSPNLGQLKGAKICDWIQETLKEHGRTYSVNVFNDADAVAAGLAAIKGQLDRLTRVWTIGNGIGFGRFPYAEGPWEGGHTVISLDLKENYCACGGRGHMEGIMGHRAMRLRFMDMEPDEVFAAAKKGDKRCVQFVELWHRALAAATATQIHLEGPGRFYFTGRDINRLDLSLLKEYLWEMVKMSPLQSYTLEVVQENSELAIIGAAAAAAHVRNG